MDVRVYDSICRIPAADWNEIVDPERAICTHQFLQTVETSGINDCKFYYPVVYRDGRIIAHTCTYSISTELDTFVHGLLKRLILAVRRIWKPFLVMHTLECGTPAAMGNTISIRSGEDKTAITAALVESIESIAAGKRLGIIVLRDFAQEELPDFRHFESLGYKCISNMPCATIEVKWRSFEEYIESMRWRYRYRTKQRLKACRHKNISIEYTSDFSAFSADLHRLWLNVYNNAREYRREILTPAFFYNFGTILKGSSGLIIIKRSGETAAFSLLLETPQSLTTLFCGLDYEFAADHSCYFNLYYEAIRLAIKRRIPKVHLLATTLTAKQEVGAGISPMFLFIKHKNPLLSRLLTSAFKAVSRHELPGERHIFKNGAEGQYDAA